MFFFADVHLQKHRLKLTYSASKSSSIKFLWRCVSKGAPMTCNLYATPLQLVAFELLRLVFTFIIFGWYQVIIFFVCLSKGKESGKKSRQPLNFCHKKDLRQSRDLDLKDFTIFLQCWVDIDFRVECWATLVGSVEIWYRSSGTFCSWLRQCQFFQSSVTQQEWMKFQLGGLYGFSGLLWADTDI